MQLREIAEFLAAEKYPENTDFSYKNIIALSNPLLFDFDYPIFDNDYKTIIQTKFMKHFYQREIGSETIGQFFLKLDEKFNLIMPYFNTLYNQNIKSMNLFKTVDIQTEHNLERSGTTTNEGSTEASASGEASNEEKNTNKYSDTPQGTLVNVENSSYLTDLRINENGSSSSTSNSSSSTNSNTETISTVDEYLEHRFGFEGLNPIDQIQKIQNTFFDIDYMILNKCEDLFLKLW